MTTIFPKEQNVTPLFEQILANPTACRRFKDVFLDNLESYQETRGFEKMIPFLPKLFCRLIGKVM